MILTIPVFKDSMDEWAWHFDDKGRFNVKSAYLLQRQLADIQLGQQECSDPQNDFKWKDIWRTECTPNVRQFLWRIAHNSLPHRLSLKHRGMDIDLICPMCNRLDEDGCHLFLRCKTVKGLWLNFQLDGVRQKLLECTGPKEVINHILQLSKGQK
jgi:hypothetical protein